MFYPLYDTRDWSVVQQRCLFSLSFLLTFVFNLKSLVLCYVWIFVIVIALLYIFTISFRWTYLLWLSLAAFTKFPYMITKIVWLGLCYIFILLCRTFYHFLILFHLVSCLLFCIFIGLFYIIYLVCNGKYMYFYFHINIGIMLEFF